MDVEKIRELRLAHPFKPFNLVLNDGRKLPVDKPYYLGIAPSGRFILLSTDGWFERIRPDLVDDVDFDVGGTQGRAMTTDPNGGGNP